MRLVALAAACAAAAIPVQARADTPPVLWDAEAVEITVARGENTTAQVRLDASQDLSDVQFRIVPELTSYLSVSPATIASLEAGGSAAVTLVFSIPSNTALSTVDGTVHVLASGKHRAKPLTVILHIGHRIGSLGGSVASADGVVNLFVPEGAITGDEPIFTIERVAGGPPPEFGTPVTSTYDFGPNGLAFAKPATMRFFYDPTALPAGTIESELTLAFEDSSGSWHDLPTVVDTSAHSAAAAVFHFTRFAIVRPSFARPRFGDNFNDNSLDSDLWSIEVPPPGFVGTVAETNQRLEISLGSGAGGTGIVSRCSLTGDFDVQVDFDLLQLPFFNPYAARLGGVELGVGQFGQVGMNRGPGPAYTMVFVNALVQTPTTDIVGKLRLVRMGSTLLGLYWSGGVWFTGGGLTPASTAATRINLDLGTGSSVAPGGTVAFDNFVVNEGTVQCPP